MSGHLDMPSFPPPGLDFDVNAAAFGSTPFDTSANDIRYVVRDNSLDGRRTNRVPVRKFDPGAPLSRSIDCESNQIAKSRGSIYKV